MKYYFKLPGIFLCLLAIGCATTGGTVSDQRETVYRGWFLWAAKDTIPFVVTRPSDEHSGSDSAQLIQAKHQPPTPFCPSMAIDFFVAERQDSIRIEIGTDKNSFTLIYAGVHSNGNYELNSNFSSIPSGLYFIRKTVGHKQSIEKIVLVK